MNIDNYERLLRQSNYDVTKSKELIDNFRNGFELGYNGPRKIQQNSPNLKLRVGDEVDLWNKVMKEVKLGRYAGPYSQVPFDNYIQSPIGLVPKDGGNDTRLIFHLSYPRTLKNGVSTSVNGNTPDHICKVNYPDFSEAVQSCVEEGVNCNLGRADWRAAFRNICMSKKDWPLLIMKAKSPIDGKWYFFVDKCLPFGAKISCRKFQDFSNSIAHIVKWRLNLPKRKKITNYLDDFLFVALLKAWCNHQIEVFLQICSEINFPVAADKTFWASTQMVFLGMLLDTVRQVVCVPMEKVSKAINMIAAVLKKKKITVLQLQKICGFLNFLGRCVVPGRAFTRRLYSHFNNKLKQHHHIRVTSEMKLDLAMWEQFLKHQSVYCRPFIDFSRVLVADELDFYSDSSKNPELGFGAYFKNKYLYAKWDKEFIIEKNPSITYLELYAVVVAFVAWGEDISNTRAILFCDNIGACGIINHMSSTCKNCMVLIRLLVLYQMIYNTRIFARWVPTKLNGPADSLSRLKINKFLRLMRYKTVDKQPTAIPEILWPMSKIWID